MRRASLAVLALPFLLVPTLAAATPAGFGCLWPLNNLAINPERSRFYNDHTEWVFDLTVYVNRPAAGPDAVANRGALWHSLATVPLMRWPLTLLGCGCSSGVEHNLAKVGVEGSNPFARSKQNQALRRYSQNQVFVRGNTGVTISRD